MFFRTRIETVRGTTLKQYTFTGILITERLIAPVQVFERNASYKIFTLYVHMYMYMHM